MSAPPTPSRGKAAWEEEGSKGARPLRGQHPPRRRPCFLGAHGGPWPKKWACHVMPRAVLTRGRLRDHLTEAALRKKKGPISSPIAAHQPQVPQDAGKAGGARPGPPAAGTGIVYWKCMCTWGQLGADITSQAPQPLVTSSPRDLAPVTSPLFLVHPTCQAEGSPTP